MLAIGDRRHRFRTEGMARYATRLREQPHKAPSKRALNLKQSDLREIGTQAVEVSEVCSQNSIASSSGRCHDDRIDYG